eukprot:226339_1
MSRSGNTQLSISIKCALMFPSMCSLIIRYIGCADCSTHYLQLYCAKFIIHDADACLDRATWSDSGLLIDWITILSPLRFICDCALLFVYFPYYSLVSAQSTCLIRIGIFNGCHCVITDYVDCVLFAWCSTICLIHFAPIRSA